MWLVHAFMATLLQIESEPMSLVDLARQIARATLRDDTYGLSLSLILVDFLRFSALDAFFELYDREQPALRTLAFADEPIVAYLNASKHAHALTSPAQPHARWTADLVAEPRAWIERVARLLPFFARLRDARGTDEVVAAFRAMQAAQPAQLPSIQPAWNRLVRAKAGPLTRFRLAFFG